MPHDEIELSGGNVTQVVRVGDTVRREAGPWTPAVHALLKHLEARDFEGAPRALGYDELGREILSFIEGEIGHYPLPAYMWSDKTLQAAARLLRRYHDATLDLEVPSNAIWRLEYPDRDRHEVILHNDFAPYNLVFRQEQPVAIIDFDWAGPGPRSWDLAYAAYRFVPLSYADDIVAQGLAEPGEQTRRLRLFCAAYGFADVREILNSVVPRLELLCSIITGEAASGSAAFQKQIEEGHLAFYRREIAALQGHMAELVDGLA